MTEINTQLPNGVPCWVDLGVPDHRRAMEFYRALFGWDFDEGSADYGYYTQCLKRGLPVAAVASPPGADTRESWWTHYFATDDCDAVVKRISDAGGTIPLAPMDVMEQGRMAIGQDPTGATFGLWQGNRHIGARIVNEPGSMTWNELHTNNSAMAGKFYADVLGFGTEPMAAPDFDYTVLKVSGQPSPIGGILGTTDLPGPGGRAHWMTYFGVDDADAAARIATAQGGSVRRGPEDSPYGRNTILADPFGAMFVAIEPAPASA